MRYRDPFIEGVSDCTIPGDQSEFTGTVSEDGNHITLDFQKGMYQADRNAGLFFGLDSCTGVTKIGEMPENYVLTRQGGPLGGIGIRVLTADFRRVEEVFAKMAADRAGIKAGDRIISVESKSTERMTITEFFGILKGPIGSTVTFNVEREGWESPRVFRVIRERLKLE